MEKKNLENGSWKGHCTNNSLCRLALVGITQLLILSILIKQDFSFHPMSCVCNQSYCTFSPTWKRFSSFLLKGVPSSLLTSWATPMTCPCALLMGMHRMLVVQKPDSASTLKKTEHHRLTISGFMWLLFSGFYLRAAFCRLCLVQWATFLTQE